jgi:hypothetical protein
MRIAVSMRDPVAHSIKKSIGATGDHVVAKHSAPR